MFPYFWKHPKWMSNFRSPLTFQVIVSALFVFTVPESSSVPSDAHWATDLRDLLGRRVIQLLLLGWLLTGVSSGKGTSGDVGWGDRWLCRWIFQTSKLINCLLVSKWFHVFLDCDCRKLAWDLPKNQVFFLGKDVFFQPSWKGNMARNQLKLGWFWALCWVSPVS